MALPSGRPLRIAHRGMPHRLRENTLASFALALENGADGIELDVHATADGVVIVHHDHELSTGEDINVLTHASLVARSASVVDIPTLADVCALVNGSAELFVEIKGAAIEREVAAVLAEYAGPLAIHSFDVALIQRLAESGTRFRLGVLPPESGDIRVREVMRQCGALDVWPHHSLVDQALVDDVHSAGGRVIPWTVNDPHEARRLAALGVDGICTDDITMLLR